MANEIISTDVVPANTNNQVVAGDTFDYEKKIAALSPAERESYLEIGKKLDVHDMNSIQAYGSEVSSIVSKNGDVLLNTVRADNSVEVVKYINDLLGELNGFDDDINRYTGTHSSALKRFWYSLPGIKKLATSLDAVMNQYTTVATNVDKIAQKITTAKTIAMRDNSTLQQIFENNQQYIAELRDLIIAAKLQDDAISDELRKMQDEGAEAIAIQQVTNFQNRLRKRIADLQTTVYVFYQNLFQLEAIKENNNAIAEKSNNIVNHVIPIWKNQLPIAIIMKNQKASIEAQAKIAETTNKLLIKTSKDLKKQSIQVAQASEENIINVNTLQETTQNLIATITEVKNIHDKGAKDRKQLESQLKNFSDQLNKAIGGISAEETKRLRGE